MNTMIKKPPYLSYAKDYKNIAEIFARTPEKMEPLMQFTNHVMRSESELTVGEHELIAAYVSLLNECNFCYGSHEVTAKALNIDDAIFQALDETPFGDAIPEKIIPVLNYTRKLTETPNKIVKEDVQEILAAGWSEKTVEDIVYIVSLFAFYNRFADGLGFSGSEEVFNQSGQFLAENGYRF